MPAILLLRFIEYVEELEGKLLARDINLREIDKVCKKLGFTEKIQERLRGLQ